LERHRLLWLFIQNETNLFSLKGTFLHIAPEPIFQKRFKQLPNLHYISADLVSHWADVQMDITNIQYGDNTFDAILCSHVLEHVPDDNAAINEIYRVLVSGGWAILQVPLDPQRHQTYEDDTIIDPNERRRIFGHHDHVRIYGSYYKLRLEKAGFTVNVIPYAQRLPADKVEFYGIGADEDIYFCQKEV
jgi:SAM-dependent methyltransferase